MGTASTVGGERGEFSTAPPAPAPPTPSMVSFEIASMQPAAAGTHSAATALPMPDTKGTPSAAATSPPPGPTAMPPAAAGPPLAHSPSAHTSLLPGPTAMPPAADGPPPAHSPSAHTSPPPGPTSIPPVTAGPPPAHSSSAHTPGSKPPDTAGTPPTAATWPPPPLQSSSPPSAHSPSVHTSPSPGPTAMKPVAAGPPPAHSPSAHTPPAECSPMPQWSPSSIEDAGSTTSSSPSPATIPAPRTYRKRQPPPVVSGYSSPLTPHKTRMLGERGDERVPGRTRSEGRQLSGVPEEAVSTPLPEATSFDHGVGLLSHAGKDVLMSLLANRRALNAKRVLLQRHGYGELGDGSKQHAGSGGVEESKGAPPYDTTGGGESGGSYWSLGPSERGVPLDLVSRLVTRVDVDAALSRDAPHSPAARLAPLPRQGPSRTQDVEGGA